MKEELEMISRLISKLRPKQVIVPLGMITGYTWNRKKELLRFLTEKETKSLTKKGKVWKRLDEEWENA